MPSSSVKIIASYSFGALLALAENQPEASNQAMEGRDASSGPSANLSKASA